MTRQPAIEPQHVCSCKHCGKSSPVLAMDSRIAVGFGNAALTCDGVEMWSEQPQHDYFDCMTVDEAEAIASKQPESDWRIILHGPLRSRTYQRHAANQWCLIEEGDGFA